MEVKLTGMKELWIQKIDRTVVRGEKFPIDNETGQALIDAKLATKVVEEKKPAKEEKPKTK